MMKAYFLIIIVLALFSCQNSQEDTQYSYDAELDETPMSTLPDTIIPKTFELIGYGLITDRVDGGPWKDHVNLFSSIEDTRVIVGKVWPRDTVGIIEKGNVYWLVVDKKNPSNYGYLMKGWVNEINK
jgi:hypothetical protein